MSGYLGCNMNADLTDCRLFNSEKKEKEDYIVITGKVLSDDGIFIVSIVTNSVPTHVQV